MFKTGFRPLSFIMALLLLSFLSPVLPAQDGEPGGNGEIFPLHIDLTAGEREWLSLHPVIRVGGPRNFPPFYWTSGREEPAGIGYDYISIIAENLGVEVEFAGDIPWPEVLAGIRDGSIDLLAISARSEDREEYLNFTDPLISSPLVIFTRNDSPFIGGLNDLNGVRVALIDNVTTADWLREDGIDVIPHRVTSPLEGLEALSLGKADAYIDNLVTGTYLIGERSLTNIKVAAPTDYGYYDLYMAAGKGLPELIPILNKALAAMTDRQKSRILSNRLSIKYEYGLRRSDIVRAVLIVAALAAVLLAVSMLWNRRLRREIGRRIKTEGELMDALDNVKTLQGLLPICTNCKSIRDDRGYWKEVDSYLDEHSGLSFTHSLCPDCAKKLYGEEEWFRKGKNRDG